MKLSQKDTERLAAILKVCAVCDIDSIIIEDGIIRGANESKTCALLSDCEVPAFPQKIGLGRLRALEGRLNLFMSTAAAVIDARESDRGEITMIDISAGKNKAQFRCTSTLLIKAPRSINDSPVAVLTVNKAELKTILDAIRVMGAKQVALTIKRDLIVSFEFCDAASDLFKIELEAGAGAVEEIQSTVVHYYPSDIFSSVCRATTGDSIEIVVGAAGTLQIPVGVHTVTLLPQINQNEGDDNDE
jgi:hypothetical protein